MTTQMKFLYHMIISGALTMSLFTAGFAQEKGFVKVSPQEKAKLRKAVEANPDNLEAHKAYLETFASADEVKVQYEQWMKKYPKSAAIPQALAGKYGYYSPKSGQYLLQAATLQPNNVTLWQELALDASMRGNIKKNKEYILNAAAADPQNVDMQYSSIKFLQNENEREWKRRTFELAKNYPNSDATLLALHLLGLDVRDVHEKIVIWEQLKNMSFSPTKLQVAMSRLTDAYIRTCQYAKAIKLAETYNGIAADRLKYGKKLKLARTLAEAEVKMKERKYLEAKNLLMPLSMHPEFNFEFGNSVAVMKATAMNAVGDSAAAYDSLLVFQALSPSIEIKDSLEVYGKKLGKSQAVIKSDIRAAINKNSRLAVPFELDSYISDKKVNLADFKGKVLLLSFWYPGCGPCREEMPHIEAGIKNIDKSKFAYAGVNILRIQDEFVLPFVNGTKYSFTPLGASEAIQKDYDIQVAPTNLIIDQEGKIVYTNFLINADSEKMLEMMIQSLL